MSAYTFITCPKCTRMHDTHVLVCENIKCGFSHPVEVVASVDPIEKSAEVAVAVPVGTAPAEPAPVIAPVDPIEAPGTAP